MFTHSDKGGCCSWNEPKRAKICARKNCVLGPTANLREMPAYRVLQIFVRAVCQIKKVKCKIPQHLLISIHCNRIFRCMLPPPDKQMFDSTLVRWECLYAHFLISSTPLLKRNVLPSSLRFANLCLYE